MKKFLLAITAFLLAYGGAYAQCTPSFTAAMTPVGTGLLQVTVTNTSSISINPPLNYVQYSINWGDATTTTSFYPYHNYATTGTYNVKLIATKIDSVTHAVLCKDSVTIPVTVYYTACASSFSSAVSSATQGLITFTASTPAGTPNMHYFWNFGDGSGGTGSPVNHTYSSLGNYNVTLTAIDSVTMCSYTYSSTVNTTTPCYNHTASFYAPTNIATVQCYSYSSNYTGQTRLVSWDFGDGTTGTGVNTTHTYAAAGTYYITSTVTWTASGSVVCTKTAIDTVTVISPTTCAGHLASATYTISGATVSFTDNSPTFSGQSAIEGWDFGDAVGYTPYTFATNPTHTYLANGTYNVRQFITWTIGSTYNQCIDTNHITITVTGVPPCAGHTDTFSKSLVNNTVYLYNLSPNFAGQTQIVNWNFGDGSTATGNNVNHTYSTSGNFVITSTVQWVDASNPSVVICTQTRTTSVYITACAGHNAYFTKSLSGSTVSVNSNNAYFPAQTKIVNWNFGDGSTGTGLTATHTYTGYGYFAITASVQWVDSANPGTVICSATAVDSIYIANPVPCAGHTASATYTISGSTVTFTNTSPTFSGQSFYNNWSYGDGTSITNSNTHTYAMGGTYIVRQAAQWYSSTSPYCFDTNYITITIPATTTNVIGGYIFKDSLNYPNYDSFKVWLITYNSSTSVLAAVDSVVTYGYNYVPYAFYNKASGTYLTKATKLGNYTNASFGLIPTYHDSSVYWSAAQNIIHTGGTTTNKNIWMKTGTITSGPGFIAGNVNSGANKVTGAAIPNLLIMLRDAGNNPVQMTYTDAQGNFTFSNFPLGTYSVYPEQINYITTPFNGIVLTAASHSKTGVNFGQTNTELKPKTTGIEVLSAEDAAVLYPNPSTGMVNISWKNISGTVSLSVADIAGHKVYELPAANPASLSKLDLSTLQNGIYFIHIATANGVQTQKMTILK